jgi:hypothetical protein
MLPVKNIDVLLANRGGSCGARTFNQRPNSVSLHVFETLNQSAGPPNVHVIDARYDSQAKVDTEIALRDIA